MLVLLQLTPHKSIHYNTDNDSEIIPRRVKALWQDDYGALRIGHTDDMIQMLDDLKIPSRSR